MNAKAETGMSVVDLFKWLIATALVVGGVWGFYELEEQVLAPVRVLGLVAVIGLAAVVAAMTERGRSAVAFMKAANIERQKVVWPTRKETTQTTLIVVAMVAVVALILWMLDSLFAVIIKMILGQGG